MNSTSIQYKELTQCQEIFFQRSKRPWQLLIDSSKKTM